VSRWNRWALHFHSWGIFAEWHEFLSLFRILPSESVLFSSPDFRTIRLLLMKTLNFWRPHPCVLLPGQAWFTLCILLFLETGHWYAYRTRFSVLDADCNFYILLTNILLNISFLIDISVGLLSCRHVVYLIVVGNIVFNLNPNIALMIDLTNRK
jgi:hypothetical protein